MGLQEKIEAGGVELALRPVAGRIGAEVSGVDVGGGLGAETVARIRQALLTYKVLFFRNQHRLTLAGQEAFAKCFGNLEAHPTIPRIEGTESALRVVYEDGSTAANQWHTDESFQDALPMAGILHAVVLPAVGGDTIWANTATAYEHMPEPLRDLADRLWALHANTSEYNAARRHPKAVTTIFETEQPLVRVHPETGERALLLGFHAQTILGLSRHNSARLMSIFQDHITRPENTARWHWEVGDVAFWDNRATQHYGIGDFTERRELQRVSIAGDVPVSVDGRRSVVRRKEEWRRQ